MPSCGASSRILEAWSLVLVREPVVAGRYYPAEPSEALLALGELLRDAEAGAATTSEAKAGIVPHAGWRESGDVTAEVMVALARSTNPDFVVLFGGVHRNRGKRAAIFGRGRWLTPLGDIESDTRLCERILGHTSLIAQDAFAHEEEHSIEVQLPFILQLFPRARIVPIAVPPIATAPEVGQAVARTLTAYKYNAVIVGTTDLTHYGPHYGFIPEGVGESGNRWAKEINDQRFLDLLVDMKADALVPAATEHRCACSSGAAAATVAAAVAMGATSANVLRHTSSAEVAESRGERTPDDSVGYAGVVFE